MNVSTTKSLNFFQTRVLHGKFVYEPICAIGVNNIGLVIIRRIKTSGNDKMEVISSSIFEKILPLFWTKL